MIGDDTKEKQVLSQCLATEFEIKALGKLKYFFGIEVTHSKYEICISQVSTVVYHRSSQENWQDNM